MAGPEISGALEGLKILDLSDLPRYKAAAESGQQLGWDYYFPYLLSRNRGDRSVVLLGEEEGSICLFLWRLRNGEPKIDLPVAPTPVSSAALTRCLERANEFNGDRSARILRVDAKDSEAVASLPGPRVKERKTQYLYSPEAFSDIGGRRFRTLRRNVVRVEGLADLEVAPYGPRIPRAATSCFDAGGNNIGTPTAPREASGPLGASSIWPLASRRRTFGARSFCWRGDYAPSPSAARSDLAWAASSTRRVIERSPASATSIATASCRSCTSSRSSMMAPTSDARAFASSRTVSGPSRYTSSIEDSRVLPTEARDADGPGDRKLVGLLCNCSPDGDPKEELSPSLVNRAFLIHRLLEPVGIDVFLYSPRDVTSAESVRGFTIAGDDMLATSKPVPRVNANWTYGTRRLLRKGMGYRRFEKFAKENGIAIYVPYSFSELVSNKRKAYDVVSDYDADLHPHTEDFTGSMTQIASFLERADLVFIKPRSGNRGNRIFVLRQNDDELSLKYYESGTDRLFAPVTVDTALDVVTVAAGNKSYVIQQGVDSLRFAMRYSMAHPDRGEASLHRAGRNTLPRALVRTRLRRATGGRRSPADDSARWPHSGRGQCRAAERQGDTALLRRPRPQ